jgi:methanogenic corrinoid protein MtbC1
MVGLVFPGLRRRARGARGAVALVTARRTPAATYSIRVASRLTGITPETLRMWERRYGVPTPARSASGLRAYSEQDIERLRLIAAAIAAGYRPREVVAVPLARLRAIDRESAAAPAPTRSSSLTHVDDGNAVGAMLTALHAHDVTTIEAILRREAAGGARRFVVEIVSPLVRRVGDAWASGRLQIRHEHLISEILTLEMHALRLRCAIQPDAKRILLATLPDELHGLGLEMVGLYLAAGGLDARVLGVSTPPREIARAARALDADVVGLSISASADARGAARAVDEVLPELPRRVPLWLGGEGTRRLRVEVPGVQIVPTWRAVDQAVARLVRSRPTAT